MRKISVLPNNWTCKKLPEVMEFLPGRAHEPYISDAGDYIVANSKFVSTGGLVKKFATTNVSPAHTGDVLIVMSDLPNGRALGKAYLVKEHEKIAVNQRVCALRTKVGCPEFYYYQLDRNRYFLDFDDGINQTHLLNPVFENCLITCPPLPEQRKIAEILQTWDAAIQALQALREAKQERQKALTRALVFGSLRLSDFRETGPVVAHRWFTLPGNWSCKPIGKVAVEVSERQGEAEAAEVLSCSKHDGFVRSLEYFKKQVFSSDLANYKRIWRDDFGFPSNHVEEGSIGLQNLVDVGVVSPIYTVFRFAPDKVDPRYAYAVLKTGLYRHIFEVSTSASVDRRGSLRWSEFSKLPFPLPPLPEQRAIVEVLQTANADIAGLSREIEALTRQKQGLMQKLLTGEWRVKVDGNEGVAA